MVIDSDESTSDARDEFLAFEFDLSNLIFDGSLIYVAAARSVLVILSSRLILLLSLADPRAEPLAELKLPPQLLPLSDLLSARDLLTRLADLRDTIGLNSS